MKICSYCGRSNAQDAARCAECGTPEFHEPTPELCPSPAATSMAGKPVPSGLPTLVRVVLVCQIAGSVALLRLAAEGAVMTVHHLFVDPALLRFDEVGQILFTSLLSSGLLASSILAFNGRLVAMRALIVCQGILCVSAAAFGYAGLHAHHAEHWFGPLIVFSALGIAVVSFLFAGILLIHLSCSRLPAEPAR